MINSSVIIGRMTKDPELRRTQNGTAVTSFNLACNRTFQTNDGQEADFIPCVCWNKLAENVEEYCSKGSLVGVTGSLRSRNYENSHGQKVFVLELQCDSVQFLETKRDRTNINVQNTQSVSTGIEQNQNQNDFYNQFGFDIMDDDMQF